MPHDKLIFILLKFIADKGHAFSLAFRLLNVDKYSLPIRITIEAQTRKMASFLGKFSNLELNSNTLRDSQRLFGMRASCVPNLIGL